MPAEPQSHLLGFDARALDPSFDALWTPERRERFLLRPGAAKPLSTDTLVWPSLFDTGQGIGMTQSERRLYGLAGIPLPDKWIGANVGLWANLEAMRQYLPAHGPYCVVAATWISDRGFQSGPVGPYAEPTIPAALDPAWALLGFDVSDGSFCSGLSNCGYKENEARVLRPRWAPHLNDSHLFREAAGALEFCRVADARVPEHAPFFAYGLYRIEG